jgi:hypothetical protein
MDCTNQSSRIFRRDAKSPDAANQVLKMFFNNVDRRNTTFYQHALIAEANWIFA